MSRYLGGTLAPTRVIATTGGGRSGSFTLNELANIEASTHWWPPLSFITSTFSTVNAASYTFANQSVGAADENRRVYVVVGTQGSGSSGQSGVTMGGTAANVWVGNGYNTVIYVGTPDPSVTTSAIVVTMANTAGFCGIHIYSGTPRQTEAHHSTVISGTTASTAETATIDIPIGSPALVAWSGNVAATTAPFTAGTTVAIATTFGTEGASGRLVSGITNASTAYRPGHTITTTHTSGGGGVGFVIVAGVVK